MDHTDFLNNFSTAAVVFNSDLRIIDANSQFKLLFCHSMNQIKQKRLSDFLKFQLSADEMIHRLGDLLKNKILSQSLTARMFSSTNQNITGEMQVLIQKTGSEGLLLGILYEIEKPANKFRPDVTETHLFKLLLNELPDAIYFKDLKGRFFLTNRLHAKKLNFESAENFIGKSDFDLFSKEHAQQAFDDEQFVIKTGETISKEEKETHFDGSETWASTSKMPLRNEEGKIVGTFGISKDITQIKIAEIQLRKAEKILQEANDAKDKFFSILAHDLKNPFNSLIGLSDILLDDFDEITEEEKLDMIQKILRTSESAYALLENLLDWASVQTGSLSKQTETLELFPIIQEILEVNQLHADNKNIKLISDIPKDILLKADQNMLRTVLRNLVSNAIKYTMPGGRVGVSAVYEGNMLKITVADNGLGMDEATCGKLFKISEKVKTYGTADESGTGLGLIIVREFVEENNGTISVESKEGKGSNFIVRFPGADDLPKFQAT
ncbi:MAG: PAS domain-containing protein [Bacteroidales bacterium]|nr:PAS domain-containing protein [Bacteroidales bacterium]